MMGCINKQSYCQLDELLFLAALDEIVDEVGVEDCLDDASHERDLRNLRP
jgi:hypothetical protein